MISDRIMPGTDWLNAPTLGILYRDQDKPDTARRLRITTAGDLWLIPPGGTDVNEAIFGAVAAEDDPRAELVPCEPAADGARDHGCGSFAPLASRVSRVSYQAGPPRQVASSGGNVIRASSRFRNLPRFFASSCSTRVK